MTDETVIEVKIPDIGEFADVDVIEVLVNRLRKKLKADLIKTRRGLGYQLKTPETGA